MRVQVELVMTVNGAAPGLWDLMHMLDAAVQ